jgi:hypothetical protein
LTSGDLIGNEFGSGEPFSVGVEEELFLVDPISGRQANSSAAVRDRLGPVHGTIERELHACQMELITDVCRSADEAVGQLSGLRRAVLETGAGLLGSGTHPSALEGEAEITDKERYERIRELLGDAVATPVGGLHIHIGMPDADTAIRVFNGLRRHLPLLQALAANSPFRHGRDTGLASAREVTLRGWPRSGVPRAMGDFADFRPARGCWREPRRCLTTRGSGGSCVRIRALAQSRSERWTPRRRLRTPQAWWRSLTAWPATRPRRVPSPIPRPTCSTRACSERPASASAPGCLTRKVNSVRLTSFWRKRSGWRGGMRTSCTAPMSSTRSRSCWGAGAVRGASAPRTESPAWTRCFVI